jgi:hypothetical protein
MLERLQAATAVISAITLATAGVSCSYYERVPRNSYRELDASDAERWKVETTDGTIYAVTRFSMTDSTLVMEEFARNVDPIGREYSLVGGTPYVLKLDEVKRVEKWVGGNQSAPLIVVGLVVVVGVVLLVIFTVNMMEETVPHALNTDQ